ncbi:ECF-type sigma factor [Schlesneria paludicola]|uniref:ECF-type sigma factor n=1 Tax=Schlesneria paludicola TaxID=360056 RepID=UPI00029ADF23|nr:ECF-type sigma factor [Schlesneria paludicola]
MKDVTRVLSAIEQGDTQAAEELLPLVYQELRRMAASKMAQECPDHTLQATALVHEAYLRLVNVEHAQRWDSRGHFFAAAAEAMRRILIESARRKGGPKRGGDWRRIDLDAGATLSNEPNENLLMLDEALTKFATVSPERAELVKLRFFAGMTIPEAAAALKISRATAERHWTYARVWLYCELSEQPPQENSLSEITPQ